MSRQILADGGFFPSNFYINEDIYQPSQKGFIAFNNGIEDLVIEDQYQGNVSDFALIIPLPSRPDVSEASQELFEDLHYLTIPISYKMGFGIGAGALAPEGVQIIEQRKVGIYDMTILNSTDANALVNWLNLNNYSFPYENSKVIEYYINRNWYFVALKIDIVRQNQELLNNLTKIDSKIDSFDNAKKYISEDVINDIISKKSYSDSTSKRFSQILDVNYTGNYTFYNMDYNGYGDYVKNNISEKISKNMWYGCDYESSIDIAKSLINCDCSYAKDYFKGCPECNTNYLNSTYIEYTSNELFNIFLNALKYNCECTEFKNFAFTTLGITQKDVSEIDEWTRPIWLKVQDYGSRKVVTKYKEELGLGNKYYYFDCQIPENSDLLKDVVNLIYSDISKNISYERSTAIKIPNYITAQELGVPKSKSSFIIRGYPEDAYNNDKKLYFGYHDISRIEENIKEDILSIVDATLNMTQKRLNEGTIQPLSFQFNSNQIIYPLKISSLNRGKIEVLLYTLTNYKTTNSKLNLEYADWISQNNLKSWNFSNLFSNSSQKYYLTKLRANFDSKTIEDDLIMEKAANNDPYRMSATTTSSDIFGIILSLFILLFALIIITSPIWIVIVIIIVIIIIIKKRRKKK
jgi:hypothetical protein